MKRQFTNRAKVLFCSVIVLIVFSVGLVACGNKADTEPADETTESTETTTGTAETTVTQGSTESATAQAAADTTKKTESAVKTTVSAETAKTTKAAEKTAPVSAAGTNKTISKEQPKITEAPKKSAASTPVTRVPDAATPAEKAESAAESVIKPNIETIAEPTAEPISGTAEQPDSTPSAETGGTITTADIPEYSGKPYVELYDNIPNFSHQELKTESVEQYSALDALGRCGTAYAILGPGTMPTEERGSIGQVKPSGWHTVKYDNIEGKYLYNRCHLIGYQLSGENANPRNLITGTRYLNVTGMLPFEDMVADYIRETDNHVVYKVTPVYRDADLVAYGVQIEAESVEDAGDGILFNVFCYNVQPGITIDYATGASSASPGTAQTELDDTYVPIAEPTGTNYVINAYTDVFHQPDCYVVHTMKEENKKTYHGTREALIEQGYQPCAACKP